MPLTRSTRLAATAIAGIGALIAVGGGYAAASGRADANGVIHACERGNGSIRIVDRFPCSQGEAPIQWNQAGAKGAAGAPGVAGPTGLPGKDGVNGFTGVGTRGADGASVLSGHCFSINFLPSRSNLAWPGNGFPFPFACPPSNVGQVGDLYLDQTSSILYGPKTADGWPAAGSSLRGTNGTNGANGTTIRSGMGAPGSATGAAGDFYLDRASMTFYGPKSGEGWPEDGTSLKGSAGTAGAAASTACSYPVGEATYPGTLTQVADLTAPGAIRMLCEATVPDVVGKDVAEATTELEAAGFVVHNFGPADDTTTAVTGVTDGACVASPVAGLQPLGRSVYVNDSSDC